MIRRYYEESKLNSVVQRWGDTTRPLEAGYRSSTLKRAVDRLASITRQSFLFRWLTAEPDPDVIVIDLRETWTVGPVIALVDLLAPSGIRSWKGSAVRELLDRTATAFRAAPVQFVSAVVLALLLIQFAVTWTSASDSSLALLCFLSGLALLGLRAQWTWDELKASNAGRLVAALFVPPEPSDEETR